jgi:hypothetical protein
MKEPTITISNSSSDMDVLLNTVIQYGPKILQNRPLIILAMANAEKSLIKDGQK